MRLPSNSTTLNKVSSKKCPIKKKYYVKNLFKQNRNICSYFNSVYGDDSIECLCPNSIKFINDEE